MTLKYIMSILLLLLLSLELYAQESVTLTLEECIRYAKTNNVEMKNANLEKELAKARIGETRAQGLPQLTGNAEGTYNAIVPTIFIPVPDQNGGGGAPPIPGGGGAQPTSDGVIPLAFAVNYQAELAAQLTQMIFDGSYFVGLKAAKTYKQLADKDFIKTETDVIENVKKSYYGVLVGKERIDLLQNNLTRLESLYRETQMQYENGLIEKVDVSRVKVQLNNVKTQFKQAQRALQLSKNILKLQVGMPLSDEIDIADRLADIESELEYEGVDQDFDFNDRIEFQQLSVNRELAELEWRNFRSGYYPKLEAFSRFGANSGFQNFDAAFDNWFGLGVVGVRLSVPIFDGFLKKHQMQQSRIQMQQLDNQRTFLKDNIAFERMQADIDYRNGLEELEVQKENKELAETIFENAKKRYQAGLGSNFELIDAESAFKEAETNYFNALYDVLIAKVDRERADGKLLTNDN
ncbi:MAG: TolC family protein [Cyclobacteriaceae bacterium]|nr:TolC family protein [Cyclobacteriaceae bacterium]MCH8517141.1 TolC family protein [Cyclobacteriaceae bacterium]